MENTVKEESWKTVIAAVGAIIAVVIVLVLTLLLFTLNTNKNTSQDSADGQENAVSSALSDEELADRVKLNVFEHLGADLHLGRAGLPCCHHPLNCPNLRKLELYTFEYAEATKDWTIDFENYADDGSRRESMPAHFHNDEDDRRFADTDVLYCCAKAEYCLNGTGIVPLKISYKGNKRWVAEEVTSYRRLLYPPE